MGTKPKTRRTSLANALFSATRQRVLGLLFGQPGRSFFANEVIRRTGAGSGAVQRELARLAESGLVTVTRVGNQVHYQADPAAPIFAELRGIVLKTSAGRVELPRDPKSGKPPRTETETGVGGDWAVWQAPQAERE